MQGNVFVGFFNFVFIIGIDIKCFPVKVINYFLQCFSMKFLVPKVSVKKYVYFFRYFSEQILVALARNSLNKLIVLEGAHTMWFNLHIHCSCFGINIEFLSPFVIFCFYFGKVQACSFAFIFECKLNLFVLFFKTILNSRSSRSRMSFKIGVLKNFTNFAVKYLCWNLFLIKWQTCFRNF